jgi:hypothetical protein
MAARSPIRLVTQRLLFGIAAQRWTCDEGRLRGAKFEGRRGTRYEGYEVIVHPSTKGPGWQASYFERGVPYRDAQGASCDVLLREVSNKSFRLREVVTK